MKNLPFIYQLQKGRQNRPYYPIFTELLPQFRINSVPASSTKSATDPVFAIAANSLSLAFSSKLACSPVTLLIPISGISAAASPLRVTEITPLVCDTAVTT